jgi:hypothetical protein
MILAGRKQKVKVLSKCIKCGGIASCLPDKNDKGNYCLNCRRRVNKRINKEAR